METWFIYAMLTTLSAGLISFSSKVSVEKNHNPSLVTFYSMSIATICSVVYFFVTGLETTNLLLEVLFGAICGLFYLVTILTRIKALKYIDTSTYFPIYKAIGPIILLLITILLLGESFSFKESIGITLGILVPLILVSKKSKNKNIRKGLFYMFIGLITAVISGLAIKFASIYKVNLLSLTVFNLFFQTMGAYFMLKKYGRKKKIFSLSKIKRVSIITGLLNFLGFYTFAHAVDLSGSLGLVYVLQSLYIVIPIVLAVIFYKEHFDFKKFIAIILTIASIYFMK